MKKIIILSILLVLELYSISYAKLFQIENSNGELIQCGEWKNTPNAIIIRNCPQLGDFLDVGPTPTPSPIPTVIPTGQPVICEYRFVNTDEGLKLDRVYEPDVITHTCAFIPKVNKLFIEVKSVNRANTQCNSFIVLMRSPSGIEYESIGSQPGLSIQPEVGTWQIDIKLQTEGLCAVNKSLLINILTKG